MKFSIAVDVDWLDNEETVDDRVKSEIIDGIVGKMSKKLTDDLAKEASKKLEKVIDGKLNETLEAFLDGSVQPTDTWGDPVGKPRKIREIMREKLDKFLTEKVNSRGEASSYGNHQTRLDYFIQREISPILDASSSSIVQQVNKMVKDKLNEGLAKTLGQAILEKADLPKIIEQAIKG